jgi:hypothetical protein
MIPPGAQRDRNGRTRWSDSANDMVHSCECGV